MKRQEFNQRIWMTDRLLALVRKTVYLDQAEQIELIDYLEAQKSRYRLGLREQLQSRA